MRLKTAARRFDTSVMLDGYTGVEVGRCQLSPVDYFKLDGASLRVRAITVSPDVEIPSRRCIQIGDERYIVGGAAIDHWRGSPIRANYTLHQTPGLATVKTIAEALADAPGHTLYASRLWNKDVADLQTSSNYFNDYHIFFASTENINTYDLIWIDGHWHICHSVHPSLSGFADAVSHEILGTVFETVSFGSQTYDPITDSYSGTPVTVKVLRVRWQEHFAYLNAAQETYQRGDETIFVLKTVTPKPSDTLALSDGSWRVLHVADQGTHWSLHARRA